MALAPVLSGLVTFIKKRCAREMEMITMKLKRISKLSQKKLPLVLILT